MKFFAQIDGNAFTADLDADADAGRWWINDRAVSANLHKIGPGHYLMNRDGRIYQAYIHRESNQYQVAINGERFQFALDDEKTHLIRNWLKNDRHAKKVQEIRAPMPGLIIELPVVEGQEISEGDTVAIIEAMKMENEIKATMRGIIEGILVKQRESVDKNTILITIR